MITMQIRVSKLAWSAAGLFAVGTATGLSAPAWLQSVGAAGDGPAPTPSSAAGETSTHLIASVGAPNYRAIVAENKAAVVGITAKETPVSNTRPWANEGPSDGTGNPPFQFFRGLPMPKRRESMHIQGSGFLVSPDGVVLTNAHVIDGAKVVTVKLSDHREFKAKVLGADTSSDIAVLKIDAHNLPTVRLGNSDQLAVGDYVLAIGEPFGLEETATAGIVSATARSLPGDGYVPFIQTDAAVNPGNSGGPLFDSNGRVVGINAQIYSNSGGYQGVSFAIPINVALHVEDQIVKTGKVAHARLGVEVQTLDQSLADSFKLSTPSGALVAKVEPESAAAQAGVQAGDVILKLNGVPISDAGQLSARIGEAAPGDQVSIELWRGGKTVTVTAKVGSAAQEVMAGNTQAPARLGLSLRPLTPEECRQAGVSSGLVVDDAEGAAADAGIQPGDVVLSVDGTSVSSVAQMRKIVSNHDKQIALLIQRGDNRIFVPVTLG
jgi:serine protease Do